MATIKDRLTKQISAAAKLKPANSKKTKLAPKASDKLSPDCNHNANNTAGFDAFKNYLNNDTQQSLTACSERELPAADLSQQNQTALNETIFNNIPSTQQLLVRAFKTNPSSLMRIRKNIMSVGSSNSDMDLSSVDAFFDKIEHSIAAMGDERQNLTGHKIPDQVLEEFFDECSHDELAQIDWSNENFDASIASNTRTQDLSFGYAMKQALLANASKSLCSPKLLNMTGNRQSQRRHAEFRSMGPFYGLPQKVYDLIKLYKGIDSLYDWQDECLKLDAIKSKRNLIYTLPTSGGKTLVSEILVLKEILCFKRNAIFILPFVAIVQEKVWDLSPFAVALDFLVEEYAANKGSYPPRKRRRKNSVYIATIEKALGLINSLIETERLHEIGLIVVDELHLVGEQGRGATLEALLTKLMYINAEIHIVGMSATIGNIQDLCTFLNADVYSKDFRPVELTEYIKCGTEIAKINSANNEEELFTVVRKTNFAYSDSVGNIDPDELGGLVMEIIPDGSCLIFCHSKKNCENVAYLLCRILHKKLLAHRQIEKQQIINGLKDETGMLCQILNISIKFGVAYHHSGLTSEERRLIEEGFRAGVISVICCTSTLATGVNLPAKRVILRQPYIGRDFINLSKYKQMIGRAGRAGLGETGDSILICSNADLPKVRKLLLSPMDQALSNIHQMDGRNLRHLLLSCIGLGIANTRLELREVTKKTLLAVQINTQSIDVVDIKKLTDRIICDLIKLGALQEADLNRSEYGANVTVRLDASSMVSSGSTVVSNNVMNDSLKKRVVIRNNTKLVISKLGCAAIKGNFELTRARILYDDLYQAQKSLVLVDNLHLLYLVTPYDVAEQIKPNKNDYYNILSKLGPRELQTAKILGLDDSVAMRLLANQKIKNVPERVLNRFYLALVIYDLWNEMPVFEVSEKYQINRGTVQNLLTSAATFASNVVNFCQGLDEFWPFVHLIKGINLRLSHCCIRELLPLMELPAVKQGRAKQLYNAGYKTLQSIAKANVNSLIENIEFMSTRLASQLIAASKMLLLEKVENLREEAEDVMEGSTESNPQID